MQEPRPASQQSNISQISNTSNIGTFRPAQGSFTVNEESKDSLRSALEQWAKQRWVRRGSCPMLSWKVGLPPKQTEKLVSNAGTFLRRREVTAASVLGVVKLDLLSPAEVEEVAKVIGVWREKALVTQTPSRKKTKTSSTPKTPVAQPMLHSRSSAGTKNVEPSEGKLYNHCTLLKLTFVQMFSPLHPPALLYPLR